METLRKFKLNDTLTKLHRRRYVLLINAIDRTNLRILVVMNAFVVGMDRVIMHRRIF